jgi:FtsH-binding integral membrane protein
MAWETPEAQAPELLGSSSRQILAEESARAFMARVYQWMVAGLAVTGATAFAVAHSEAALSVVLPLTLPLSIVTLIMVFGFSFLAPKVSTPVAAAMFLGYSLMNGLIFSVLFLVYAQTSIYMAFGITAATFGAMSVYGTVTKKDLSSWGSFLFMGLFGIIIASVVNLFMHSSGLSWVVSCAAVVIFTGLTAYDTQKLRAIHASSGYASAGTLAINGALILYLDFINLMLALLRLLGRRR